MLQCLVNETLSENMSEPVKAHLLPIRLTKLFTDQETAPDCESL